MLLIFLSWVYILAISLVLGASMNVFLQRKNQHSIITFIFGFFGVTLLASLWAIPFAINGFFHIFLLTIAIVLGVINKKSITECLQKTWLEIKEIAPFLKGILIIISFLILAQAASPPFLIDNESYYTQTIKWLNEYGFVNGLVNLHVFLGQTSGWHILQSAFNFSFLYQNFNDISALVLLLGNFYTISLLSEYITKRNPSKLNLVFGLFPLWNVFLFQFISAPSPDIAIYVLGFILLHQFILCYNSYTKSAFLVVVLLSLFLAYIKLTGFIFCIFPLVLYKRYFVFTRSTTSVIVLFGSLTLLLFAIKNMIVTGNLLFPLEGIDSLKTSWSLPKEIEAYFANYMQPYAYHLSAEAFEKASIWFRLKTWLLAPIPYGVFNLLMIILLAIIPFTIKKLKHNGFWTIYYVAVFNMLLLFITSPQYRFFFPFILCFSLILASLILIHKTTIKVVLVFCTILTIVPLFFQTNNKHFTANKYHQATSLFSIKYFLKPYQNSKYPKAYKTIKLNETSLNTPTKVDFFWGTGDIPLPAINKEQLQFFIDNFDVQPQQRSKNLKDGFISKKLD